MVLPNFLIIGAMKAGTTTLYRDLYEHPSVYFPETKEPNNLCDDDVLSQQGTEQYAKLFKRAAPAQIVGEASTSYSKLPTYPGVPERARAVLGPKIKIIYLVRHPIERIVSHHQHNRAHKLTSVDIGSAVRESPEYIAFSSYRMQLAPWLATFGEDRVMVVRFEDYVANRLDTLATIQRFLDIPVQAPPSQLSNRRFNATDNKRVPYGFWRKVTTSSIFACVRPYLPWQLRVAAKCIVVRPQRVPKERMSASTIAYVMERLDAGDYYRLHDEMPRLAHSANLGIKS